MPNRILKKVAILIIFMLIIIFQTTISKAVSFWYGSLMEAGIYCIQHGASFPGQSQGYPSFSYRTGSSKTYTSKSNDSGTFSLYNAYLYYYAASHCHGGVDRGPTVWQSYIWGSTYKAAKNYEKNDKGEIDITPDKSIRCTRRDIGPFKLKSDAGKISKITVYDLEGNVIDQENWVLMQKDAKGVLQNVGMVYDNNLKKDVYNLAVKREFYIEMNEYLPYVEPEEPEIDENASVDENSTEEPTEPQEPVRLPVPEVGLVVFEGGGPRTWYKAWYTDYYCSSAQNIRRVRKSGSGTQTAEAAAKRVTVRSKKGTILIHKRDSVTKEPVEGVTFLAFCDYKQKYLKRTPTGWDYTSSVSDATKFTTADDGMVSIENIPIESMENTNYTLIEIGSENGYYNDPIVIKAAGYRDANKTKQSFTATTVEKLSDNSYKINKIPIQDQVVLEVAIDDLRTSGNLTITKSDSIDETVLGASEFKIKLEQSSNYTDVKNMWLKGQDNYDETGENNENYANFNGMNHEEYLTSDESEASIYKTDEHGELEIKGILTGTYHIYEVKGTDRYDIEGQPNYVKEKNWVDLGTVTVSENEEITISGLKNDITRGKLEIDKVDSIHEDLNLSGAEFILYLEQTTQNIDAEGWVKWLEGQDYLNTHFSEFLSDDETDAGKFTTDSLGHIEINGLLNGIYHIYEVKTPSGYNIEYQEGYDSQKGWVDLGTIEVNSFEDNGSSGKQIERKTIKYNVSREKTSTIIYNQKIINKENGLYGYVWKDGETKSKNGLAGNAHDSLYGTADKLLSGIPTTLYRYDGKVIATTQTDENGKYNFSYWGDEADKNLHVDPTRDELYYWDLVNAYIEFEYDNKTYICANPFEQGGIKVAVNSKAQEDVMEQSELDEHTLTGSGLALTKKDGEGTKTPQEIVQTKCKDADTPEIMKDYGLTAYYNDSTFDVENINFALWELFEPTYTVQETLQYSKIMIKGYTYTYDYVSENAQLTPENLPDGVTTRLQEGANAYGAQVYPSDVAYTCERDASGNLIHSDGMEMYLVYKIDVINTTDTHIRDIYDEYRLYLDSLVNSYDSERFEICNDKHLNDANYNGSEYFKLWSDGVNSGDGTTYNKTTEYDLAGEDGTIAGDKQLISGIEPGTDKKKSVYIQFRVKNEFLEKLLDMDTYINILNEQMSRSATTTYADGYHIFYRDDNLWNGGKTNFISNTGIRVTDNSINSLREKYSHKTYNYEEDSGALALLVFFSENERSIDGCVFEDNKIHEGEEGIHDALGNGRIDDNEENRTTNVQVELLSIEEDGSSIRIEPAIVYQKNADYEGEEAVFETDSSGNYSILGVVPGLYYLKFTYPTGEDTIMTVDGTVVKTNEYKSTIINTQDNGMDKTLIKDAKENMENIDEKYDDIKAIIDTTKQNEANMVEHANSQKQVEWYKYLNNPNYNIATDDFERRNSLGYKYYTENKDRENTIVREEGGVDEENYVYDDVWSYSPYFSITIENTKEAKGNVSYVNSEDNSKKWKYEGFNLGLIKIPDTIIDIDKNIVNIKLTDTVGTVLSQGNPTEPSDYITALDEIAGGSKYVRVEMQSEEMYGSVLSVTYEVTIYNNSEQDYIESKEVTRADGTTEDNQYYGYYFKYGDRESGDARLKQLSDMVVLDIIDKDYDLEDQELDQKLDRPENSKDGPGVGIVSGNHIEAEVTQPVGGVDAQGRKDWSEDPYFKMTGWDTFESGGKIVTTYVATGRLKQDLDLMYENAAKVISFKTDAGITLKSGYIWEKYGRSNVVITPDTGGDRRYTYYIAGMIGLILVGTGIIVIVKKVV